VFMTDNRVIMRNDYSVLCLDTVGYVTAGNSRLASGYKISVGTYHCHLQSGIDETKYMVTCILWCKKVNQSRYRPGQAQRVGRGTALPFCDLGGRERCDQHHAPAALPPGKTRYPL
jgi:hypothetical protein